MAKSERIITEKGGIGKFPLSGKRRELYETIREKRKTKRRKRDPRRPGYGQERS